MKLNKNRTTLIILLILSLTSLINSEPTKKVASYGYFMDIKYQKITLRLNDEFKICEHRVSTDVRMKIDHDDILKPIKGEYLFCQYFIAVKPGEFEIIFKIKSDTDPFNFSKSTVLKGTAYETLLSNYKTWDVVVSY